MEAASIPYTWPELPQIYKTSRHGDNGVQSPNNDGKGKTALSAQELQAAEALMGLRRESVAVYQQLIKRHNGDLARVCAELLGGQHRKHDIVPQPSVPAPTSGPPAMVKAPQLAEAQQTLKQHLSIALGLLKLAGVNCNPTRAALALMRLRRDSYYALKYDYEFKVAIKKADDKEKARLKRIVEGKKAKRMAVQRARQARIAGAVAQAL